MATYYKPSGQFSPLSFLYFIIACLIVLPILLLFRGGFSLYGLVSIIGGLLLLTHVFGKVPSLEETLRKVSSILMPFKAIIGIALMAIGVLTLLKIL